MGGRRHAGVTLAQQVTRRVVRSPGYRLSVQRSALRPQGIPPPELRMSVDGTLLREVALAPARQEIWVDLPTRDQGGAVVTIDLSNTFAPGGDDPRALGAIRAGLVPAAVGAVLVDSDGLRMCLACLGVSP